MFSLVLGIDFKLNNCAIQLLLNLTSMCYSLPDLFLLIVFDIVIKQFMYV